MGQISDSNRSCQRVDLAAKGEILLLSTPGRDTSKLQDRFTADILFMHKKKRKVFFFKKKQLLAVNFFRRAKQDRIVV